MILKAHDAYYILALSKRDLKPFLKIEKCPLFFLVLQVVVFFIQKLPPEATESMNLMFPFKKEKRKNVSHKKQYLTLGPKFFFEL